MAYTAVPTVATGDLWTAANHNTYIRDNFAAGIPDIFTTKGDIAVATASDAAARLGVGSDGQLLTADSSQSTGLKWSAFATVAATQAEQEAGSSTTAFTTPGRQQYHPSASKAWCSWSQVGTQTIAASYNVSSITDNGVGLTTINFTVSFSSAVYAITGIGEWVNGRQSWYYTGTKATGSCQIACGQSAGALADDANAQVAFFGDQ